MTNKILRKLTLSAVTLGVAAVSATTSTFAWFTTNSNVTASKVEGSVKEADGNMLLSVKNSSWQSPAKTVTLPASATSLAPVQASSKTADGKTTYSFTKAKSVGDFTDSATDGTDYIHYQLIFHMSDLATGDNIKNVVTANFNGFTGGNGSQYLLVDASTETSGAKAGDTIKVDLLDVLSMRVESSIILENDNNKTNYGISDTISATANDIGSNTTKFYRYNQEKDTVSVNNSEKNADALTYYNSVHGNDVTRPENTPSYETTYLSNTDNTSDSSKAGITLFEVTGTSKAYVKTDIYFYIDGWDKQCFNAVGGLQITAGSIDFKLTAANKSSSDSQS